MPIHADGTVYQGSTLQTFGTWRVYRGSYGTYADEVVVKTILTVSRWYWSIYLPFVIETYYETYSGTGYARYLLQGNTKNGDNMSLVTLENYDEDPVTVESTSSDGGGSYPHYTHFNLTSGVYRRGSYRILYNVEGEKTTEAAAKSASDGFYIHN